MLRAPAEKPAAARHHAQAYALQDNCPKKSAIG